MEPSIFNTSWIRDKWHCWKSRTKSERRNLSSIATIRIGWKVWAYSMECYCYLRNIQDFLADGETPHERWFGEPFKGPIIPFGAMVEYHPISARDQSRLHQFGKTSFTRNLSWVCTDRGVNLDWRYSDCGSGRIGKFGRIRNLSSENQRERSTDIKKVRRIHIPSSRYSKIVRKRLRIPRTDS